MPTPTGLPKKGEIWRLAIQIPGHPRQPKHVIVLERGSGSYWSMRVADRSGNRTQWVDCAYWFKMGWLTYVQDAGPKTRSRFGL
jgi:hypothetical protein